jgi:hypothetical protein
MLTAREGQEYKYPYGTDRHPFQSLFAVLIYEDAGGCLEGNGDLRLSPRSDQPVSPAIARSVGFLLFMRSLEVRNDFSMAIPPEIRGWFDMHPFPYGAL